ncbi:aspartyl/glutamyl-tRNA(Asn/Gln) amidotransferase subunit C [Salsuginibacillus halophilus]|uniref:Aspartyl/glutamyl-tRNA(Asn/Gln) amidotransferase subunit C n=1 Tax=Salsuginibacillus halophilus TaxID=517424 RepID=A0A2P8HLF9_9BACI|nr:Asp-tRNA(Asn)/Glu-tRNA(Gln) amidotransferase subunit GatC [Salsuginibacillus halophilus]PSL47056.1 aspartyl/glutamyl-tRNA(Asn/Gln) amidotransferase subunit C [Salsuginibacillus halophilus]
MITKEQVEHVAHLARLEIGEDEIDDFTNKLDAIIGYAEQLNELDTTNVEPTTHVIDIRNVLREDENKPSIEREQALGNAPESEDGQVKVPSVLD